MKRVLCGALAVILAIGCLTGCQEGNDLNSTNESSQAVSSKPNPADMESENTEESSMAYQKRGANLSPLICQMLSLMKVSLLSWSRPVSEI